MNGNEHDTMTQPRSNICIGHIQSTPLKPNVNPISCPRAVFVLDRFHPRRQDLVAAREPQRVEQRGGEGRACCIFVDEKNGTSAVTAFFLARFRLSNVNVRACVRAYAYVRTLVWQLAAEQGQEGQPGPAGEAAVHTEDLGEDEEAEDEGAVEDDLVGKHLRWWCDRSG